MGTTTTTTSSSTTPSRRVRTTTSSTTPKWRDSPSPNSISNGRTLSSPEPSLTLPTRSSRTTKSTTTTTTLPSPAKPPPPPTTTRKSLLLLSKPKPKSSLLNSNSPPPQSQSQSQSHPIKPSSSSPNTSNKTTPINPPTTTPSSRRDQQQHATLLLPSSRHPHQQEQHLTIATLQSELLTLRTQLQQAQSLNLDLQSQNSNLSQQLAAALSKISTLTTTTTHQLESKSGSEFHNPEFHDIQKLISDKLEHPAIIKEDTTKTSITRTPPAQVFTVAASTASTAPSPPPPPPPPLPRRPAAKAVTSQKASAVVELYQSLATKRGNGYPSVKESSYKTSSAHNSIVDEIQNRSSHLLAIKKDIETKGEFINGLIQKVLAAAYTDIEDILSFVDWLDKQLSLLVDEQAVLKHFKWPEKKADSMREAAIEYRNLKLLEMEVSSYRDDIEVPCGVALKKMARLLDKSERSLQRLIQLRSSAMLSYRSHKIPTDWMLDIGIVSKIKQASINLAKAYVKRVTLQLECTRYSERESTQEALVLQGVHFAYRAHQLCGGLDSETLSAIEEMRGRVGLGGGEVVVQQGGSTPTTQQLFGGIASS